MVNDSNSGGELDADVQLATLRAAASSAAAEWLAEGEPNCCSALIIRRV